jgi:hypothetical protein
LDGCYVIESDLPKELAGTQQVHDRYLDLTQVERIGVNLIVGSKPLSHSHLRRAIKHLKTG